MPISPGLHVMYCRPIGDSYGGGRLKFRQSGYTLNSTTTPSLHTAHFKEGAFLTCRLALHSNGAPTLQPLQRFVISRFCEI